MELVGLLGCHSKVFFFWSEMSFQSTSDFRMQTQKFFFFWSNQTQKFITAMHVDKKQTWLSHGDQLGPSLSLIELGRPNKRDQFELIVCHKVGRKS